MSNDKYILTKEVPPILGDDDLEASFSLYCCIPVLLSLAYAIKLKMLANEGYHYQLCVCRMIRSLEGNINIQERKAQYPERDVEGLHPWDFFLWLKYSVELYNYSQFYLLG